MQGEFMAGLGTADVSPVAGSPAGSVAPAIDGSELALRLLQATEDQKGAKRKGKPSYKGQDSAGGKPWLRLRLATHVASPAI